MSEHVDDQPGPPPAQEWCWRYTPGHRVHWIQAKLAVRTPGTAYRLVGSDGGHVTVRREGTGAEEVWRLHDAPRLVAATVAAGTSTVHLHEHGLLAVPAPDGSRSCFYPCRLPGQWEECSADEVGGVTGIRTG
jgi:hypothetical protein